MPQSTGMETLLWCKYLGHKYPHIYALSISIGKNQSMKICGVLYILTHEHNYKVITGSDTILHEY